MSKGGNLSDACMDVDEGLCKNPMTMAPLKHIKVPRIFAPVYKHLMSTFSNLQKLNYSLIVKHQDRNDGILKVIHACQLILAA